MKLRSELHDHALSIGKLRFRPIIASARNQADAIATMGEFDDLARDGVRVGVGAIGDESHQASNLIVARAQR